MTLEEKLAAVKGYRMSDQERYAQRISFAVGNMLCMRRYAELSPAAFEAAEWQLRIYAAKAST